MGDRRRDRLCRRSRRSAVVLAICIALGGLALSACGGDPLRSEKVVAVVGDAEITSLQLTRWQRAFMPPGSDGRLRKQALSDALGFLIRSKWIEREARRQSVEVPAADMRRAIEARTRSVGGREGLARYLARVDMTMGGFRYRVKRDALVDGLVARQARYDESVTQSRVLRFYRQHSHEYVKPATRRLLAVVARWRHTAQRARRGLDDGRAWKEIAREYSVDPSKRTGGEMKIDTNNVIPSLRRGVFAAPLGKVVGPMKVRSAWWVFRVLAHRSTYRMTVDQAAPRIRVAIRSTRQQRAVDRLFAQLERRYRPTTACAPGYAASVCGRYRDWDDEHLTPGMGAFTIVGLGGGA